MKSSKPPALATWLVEHAAPGKRNEALAGDLFEQFAQGRTSLWYWRQALGATLLAYAKEWRVFAWASAVTLLLAVEIAHSHYWTLSGARDLFGFGASRHWFLAFLSAAGSILLRSFGIMLFAANMYSGLGSMTQLRGNWKEHGLWPRGWSHIWKPLAIGYAVAAVGTLLLLAVLPERSHPILAANVAALAPVFLATVVMAFVAPSNDMRAWDLTLLRINRPGN
ncbi:MAG TPA: hypothetical protein VHX36_02390 [Candidatus Acidoferrales bacterium]|jgi:hypothetical protein|nr:hypothetical protein [Candidatus Acidoferrales bacterium]